MALSALSSKLSPLLATLVSISSLFLPLAYADSAPPPGTPAELAAWVGWIQAGHPEWRCAKSGGQYECSWPGTLTYKVGKTGASFMASAELLSDGTVPLPGKEGLFPKNLQVKSESGSVDGQISVAEDGLSIKLPAGRYTISGEFTWDEIPRAIPAPAAYGILDAQPGAELGRVEIERDGDSFSFVDPTQQPTSNSLTLRVLRRIADGSPLSMVTRLEFRVSGTARSVALGRILPNSSTPVSIETSLPFQLQKDGALSVQVGQGEHVITVNSVMPQPVATISLPDTAFSGWPSEETVVWTGDPSFRSVEVSGASALSAELANVPSEWTGGATYIAQRGATLALKELSRGEQSTASDSVALTRTLWIDLDGGGFTVNDSFTGQLSSSTRLEALPETKVGRATSAGSPLLISKVQGSDLLGIELRSTNLNIDAVSRLDGARTFSAVGWKQDINNLSIDLRLPPSWTLIDVQGARYAWGSWLGSWSLLDVFLSILIFIAAYQLFGVVPAVATGLSVFFSHGEFLAPRMLLIQLIILAVWNRLISEREGTWYLLARSLLTVTFVAWSLQMLAFAKLQVVQLLYPQLQAGTRYRTIIQELLVQIDQNFLLWPILMLLLVVVLLAARSIVKAHSLMGRVGRTLGWGAAFFILLPFASAVLFSGLFIFDKSTAPPVAAPLSAAPTSYEAQNALDLSDGDLIRSKGTAKRAAAPPVEQFSLENKVFLAGPALPTWSWRQHTIVVDSPVGPESTLTLVLLSPPVTRLLSAGRALLAIFVVAILFRSLGFSLARLKGATAVTAAPIALVIAMALPSLAAAEAPSQALLDQLQKRLESELCHEDECATITGLELTFSGRTFTAHLDVTSKGSGVVAIPGPIALLAPRTVEIDGKSWPSLRRSDEDFLEVRTPAGHSRITVRGDIREAPSFTLQIPQKPLHATVRSSDWQVEGVDAMGTIAENVRCTLRSTTNEGNPVLQSTGTDLPGWVVASRSISIADTITVATHIHRIGSVEKAVTLALPELPQEHLTSDGARSSNGRIVVTLPPNTSDATFSSVLPYTNTLALEATGTEGVSYEWLVECAPFVHCSLEGLQPTQSVIGGDRRYRWLPFPGEKAIVTIEQLKGIPGDLMTIDALTHTARWGTNLLEGSVVVKVRNTQQQNFTLTLADQSSVRSVTVDGAPAAVTTGKDSSVLLNPGSHDVLLSYNLDWKPSLRALVPSLRINGTAHNVTIQVEPSHDRWVLWTGGLQWGPAVVFWSKLLVVVSLCLWLAWLGLLPVRYPGAVFLGIGLSTLPLVVVPIPIVWLAWVQRHDVVRPLLQKLPTWIRGTGLTLFSLIAIALFYRIVELGLVLSPPMYIAGNQSSAHLLRWFTDHASGEIPQPWVLSVPMWWWRAFSLLWSTWLVVGMLRWLKRAVTAAKQAFA